MVTKVEIYWESQRGKITVVDLINDGLLPTNTVCRIEPECGVTKNFVEILTEDRDNRRDIDHKIHEAYQMLPLYRTWGINHPFILVNGVMLWTYVMKLQLAVLDSLTAMDGATAELKETRSLNQIRNGNIKPIRLFLERAADYVRRRLE